MGIVLCSDGDIQKQGIESKTTRMCALQQKYTEQMKKCHTTGKRIHSL